MYYIITIIVSLVLGYFANYLKRKAENLATKEDLAYITRIELDEKIKKQLKHEACMSALFSIDSVFSNRDWGPEYPVEKQTIDIAQIREAHNKLIVACDSVVIVNKFVDIIQNAGTKGVTNELNDLRNLIRCELSLGDKLDFDKDKAWISRIKN